MCVYPLPRETRRAKLEKLKRYSKTELFFQTLSDTTAY